VTSALESSRRRRAPGAGKDVVRIVISTEGVGRRRACRSRRGGAGRKGEARTRGGGGLGPVCSAGSVEGAEWKMCQRTHVAEISSMRYVRTGIEVQRESSQRWRGGENERRARVRRVVVVREALHFEHECPALLARFAGRAKR
jgi:hypothetical protein